MKGSCLCGAIQYEVNQFSGNIYQCHCKLCRVQGGSSSNSGAIVPLNDLVWIKGQPKTWVKDTGFTSSFCDNCGAPVPNRLRGLEYFWVPVGCLDGDSFKVVANIYLDSKASWSTVSSDGDCYEQRPEIDELISMLIGGRHA
ncbi:S-(hydroxymethyl)glutathione synthase superfamily protein [Oleiphilus messinensis]|uniref:S-(Hydroxymethyl)glutathione synthase superfamily protein n=1 Tax=Oleiphilus messinensis TaxID=141451 RepID=A0A1Y0I5U4_9GAMM|nr:S-(hydroxymethyl)glutathione synthase superfamily protein [Oleiphilus messinensis]